MSGLFHRESNGGGDVIEKSIYDIEIYRYYVFDFVPVSLTVSLRRKASPSGLISLAVQREPVRTVTDDGLA
jgi:hypothetical protein